MPISISEGTAKVLGIILGVFLIPLLVYLTKSSLQVPSISQDIQYIRENQLSKDDIMEMLIDKSDYRKDLPKLERERALIESKFAAIDARNLAQEGTLRTMTDSLNSLEVKQNELFIQLNGIRIELERFRVEQELSKKKDIHNDGHGG